MPEDKSLPVLELVGPGEEIDRIIDGVATVWIDEKSRVSLSLRRYEPFVMFLAIRHDRIGTTERRLGMCIRPHAGNSVSVSFGSHGFSESQQRQPQIHVQSEESGNLKVPAWTYGLRVRIDDNYHVSFSFHQGDAVVVIRIDVHRRNRPKIGNLSRSLGMTIHPASSNLIMVALHEIAAMRV